MALTIAGSDPSGGAGIQADLKTFHQFGVYGEAAITLVTVQNTRIVSRVEALAADLVRQQIEAVLDDIPPSAAKTGALGTLGIVEVVAELVGSFRFPLVVDPIIFSKARRAAYRARRAGGAERETFSSRISGHAQHSRSRIAYRGDHSLRRGHD